MEQEQATAPMPTRGQPIQLGGRTLYLRYTLRTRRELMDLFGTDPTNDQVSALAGDKLAQLILLGVKKANPDITVEWLEDEIDMENLQEVVQTLSLALGKKSATVISLEQPQVGGTGEAPALASA